MRIFKERAPSASMLVAFVALLAALSGTAIALPGTGGVDSGDIKNNVVRSKDVRNNNLRSKDVRNNDLRGADVLSNSLTGLDINESSLGMVPSADAANTAGTAGSASTADTANTATSAQSTDGHNFAKVNFQVPSGTALTPFLDLGGLQLLGGCGGGDLDVIARTSVDKSMIHAKAVWDSDLVDYEENDNFNSGIDFFLDFQEDDDVIVEAKFISPGNSIVTLNLAFEEEPNALGSANDCFVWGFATQA